MKKLLRIVVLGLILSSNTNAGTFEGKKFVYVDLGNLNTLIKDEDTTDFKRLEFIRMSEGMEFMNTSGRSAITGKRKIYRYDAYIFHSIYNSGHKINFFVDTNYAKNSEKAEKIALRYAKVMGQIPLFLREGTGLTKFSYGKKELKNKGVRNIVIPKGTNRARADIINEQIIIYPQSKLFFKDLILMHEAAHLTIQTKMLKDDKWLEALMADGNYITKYATSSFSEDVAETISFWVAVRCIEGYSKKKKDKILKSIPNRIKYLDQFIIENKLSTSPMVCNLKK